VRRWLLGFTLLSLSACATRCSCGEDEDLAELITLSGSQIDRDRAASEGAWQLATLGERFRVGDGLRTGKASSAELALLPSGRAQVEPHTVLRFLANAPEQRQVSIETGAVTILAQQLDLEIHTPRAIAKVPRGAKLKLTAVEGHERFDVLVGRVVVAHEGTLSTVQAAQPLELGTAEPEAPAAHAEATDTAAESAAPAVLADAGEAEPEQIAAPSVNGPAEKPGTAAPAHATVSPAGTQLGSQPGTSRPRDLSLSRLESATIHAAAPPVVVAIPTPPCSERARVAVDGASLTGDAEVNVVQLGAGAHTIRLQCAGEARSVRLVVKRDAAKMDLPRRAQNVRVEADGRRYTVRYQNLLPVVTFLWPGEHPGRLELAIRKGGRESTYPLDRPEHALPSGTLGEGEYKFSFRDARGNASPPTTLRLSFDNTARSAYLSSPADGSAVTGEGIEVAGAALLRSRVEIQDRAIAIDDKGRFRAHVAPQKGEQALTVRVEHPESGVHYYVRRVRGASE
jgi:hypothetical protein